MKHIYNNLKASHTIGVYILAFAATIVVFILLDKWKGTEYVEYKLPENCVGCKHDTPTPTPNVGYTPAPTPTPSYSSSYKEVHSLSGKLLFQYRESVYASDIDGKNSFKLIDLSKGTRLIWWSKNRIYYYAYIDDKTSALIRKDLNTQKLTTLFTFSTNVYDSVWYPGGVAMTKDERYVVYVDNNSDIFIYDTTNNTHKLLLKSNNSCKDPQGKFSNKPEYCYAYRDPEWAQDDRMLVIGKGFYEGGWLTSMDPFKDTDTKYFDVATDSSGMTIDKDAYFTLGDGYGYRGIYAVNDLHNPVAIDILNLLKMSPNNERIIWGGLIKSKDYRLAFVEKSELYTYDLVSRTMNKIGPIDEDASLQIWLPDNKTILYIKNQVWSMDLNTRIKKPLDIYADKIYGYVE